MFASRRDISSVLGRKRACHFLTLSARKNQPFTLLGFLLQFHANPPNPHLSHTDTHTHTTCFLQGTCRDVRAGQKMREIGRVGLKVDVPAAAHTVRDIDRGAKKKQSKHCERRWGEKKHNPQAKAVLPPLIGRISH